VGLAVTQILLRDVFRLNFSVTINQRRIARARVPAASRSVSLGRRVFLFYFIYTTRGLDNARDCSTKSSPALRTEISSHAASIIPAFSMRKLLVSKTVRDPSIIYQQFSMDRRAGEALTSESAILATKRRR